MKILWDFGLRGDKAKERFQTEFSGGYGGRIGRNLKRKVGMKLIRRSF